MFSGGRERLWQEKLGLVPRFAGNAATSWGTNQENEALARSALKDLQCLLCSAPLQTARRPSKDTIYLYMSSLVTA